MPFVNSKFLVTMSSEFDSIEDFLGDNRFKEWVLRPTPELDGYWNSFFVTHPEKKASGMEARQYLLAITEEMEASYPDEGSVGRIYGEIEARIDREYRIGVRIKKAAYLLAASCVAGILFWGVWINTARPEKVSYEDLIGSAGTDLDEYENDRGEPFTLQLPDSSRIHLSPGAKISYSRNFNCTRNREVYLEGNAMFEIEPDATKPFYVYSAELITRVLGTSFEIRNNAEKDQMTVSVLTGKVSVMKRDNTPRGDEEELLLMPNQQALFSRKNTQLTKSLVENPVLIRKLKIEDGFNFDDAPVSRIFATIEKAYGIEISYDEARMGNCLMTASLTDESLFDILDLVCSALDARYFVEGTKIVVTGSGCQN